MYLYELDVTLEEQGAWKTKDQESKGWGWGFNSLNRSQSRL